MSKDAMQQALEAMERYQVKRQDFDRFADEITALQKALANEALDKKAENAKALGLDYEPAPENFMDALKFDVAMREYVMEPVAYLCENAVGHKYFRWKKPSSLYKPIALYTAPPQRTWVGLTDEEMYMNCPSWLSQEQCKAWIHQIEAALRSKNT